jgi:hypothetical protein
MSTRRGHVELLHWPEEADRRTDPAMGHTARLLLVSSGTLPPLDTGYLEDWARTSADALEIEARLAVLEARAHEEREAVPTIDSDGVLRYHDAWLALGPLEAGMADLLVRRWRQLVPRHEVETVWPVPPGHAALRSQVLRLRRRLGSVDLRLRTLRSRGYLLEPVAPAFVRH